MIIQTTSGELARSLKIISKAIQSKNSMPLLDCAVIKHIENDKFCIIGGSMEATLSIPSDIRLIEGKQIPALALMPKSVMPVVDALPSDTVLNITVEGDERGGMLKFVHLSGEFKIPYLSGAEYPAPAAMSDVTCSVHFPADVILPSIDQARAFAGSDELRPVMNAVLLDIMQDQCVVVASDGHRLYRRIYGNGAHGNGAPFLDNGGEAKMMLPSILLSVLPAAFGKCETINFATNGTLIRVWSGETEYIVRSIEGRYPNYNSVIPPVTAAHTLDAESKAFLAVMRRVAPFASDASQLLSLKVENGTVELSAEDVDFSTSARETVQTSNMNIPDMAIGMKSTTLQQCIQALSAETVRLYITSPNRAIVLMPAEDKADTLTLLMPMLLNQ